MTRNNSCEKTTYNFFKNLYFLNQKFTVSRKKIFFRETVNLYFLNQKFTIEKYTVEKYKKNQVSNSSEAIAYTGVFKGKVSWTFSCAASEKIVFEIFANNKTIPKKVGVIISLQYVLQHNVLIENAVELHDNFVSAKKQLNFMRPFNIKPTVIREKLTFFSKISEKTFRSSPPYRQTLIDINNYSLIAFTSEGCKQYFAHAERQSLGSNFSRLWQAFQNCNGCYAAAIYLLQTISQLMK